MLKSDASQPSHDQPEGGTGTDHLACIATALTGYLEEVEEYCSICLRHEEYVAVLVTARKLEITRHFPLAQATIKHIRSVMQGLPGWEHSPFWSGNKETWKAVARSTKSKNASETGEVVICRGISWGGRPVLVNVTSTADARLLRMNVSVPRMIADLPELPLRQIAYLLTCHVMLVPDSIARAQPRPWLALRGTVPLRTYLSRAMPQDLYASQCFSSGGAEK